MSPSTSTSSGVSWKSGIAAAELRRGLRQRRGARAADVEEARRRVVRELRVDRLVGEVEVALVPDLFVLVEDELLVSFLLAAHVVSFVCVGFTRATE